MKNHTLKFIFLFIVLVGLQEYVSAQVCSTTTITTQAQINALSCTSINGDLIIDDNFTGSITDLNPLFTITSVSGNVIVRNNSSLQSLQGLDVIGTIGGNLEITNNNALTTFGTYTWLVSSITGDITILSNSAITDIEGLIFANLLTVGGEINIRNCTVLNELSFANLTSIGDGLTLAQNSWTNLNFNSLTSIGGGMLLLSNFPSNENLSTFDNLQTVTTGIDIRGNQGINTINGFGALTTTLSVFIVNNDFLTSINGFNALSSTNVVSIDTNLEIQTIDGFSALTNINGNLEINNNGGIASIAGFNTLSNVSGNFQINNNNIFSAPPSFNGSSNAAANTLSLNAFNALQTVGLNFEIKDNGIITSITGFSALASSSQFYIEDNFGLGTINGFNSLSTVGSDLLIRDNSDLTSITGFAALSTVGNTFRLDNNDQCTSITGFGALATVGDEFNINWNAILTQINGFDALTTVPGWFNITFNDGLTSVNGFAGLNSAARFRIHSNPVLTSVTGFQNVTAVAEGIDLYNNTQLSMCCWIEPVYNALAAGATNNIFGNATGCNSIVEIGGAAPVINCSSTQTFNTDAGGCNASFNLTDPTVTDECNVAIYTASLVDANGTAIYTDATAIPGSSFPYTLPIGTNVLSYTAEDGFGNTSSCSIALVVVDNEAPTWTNTGTSLIIQGECGVDDPIALLNANFPNATDNCGVQGINFTENTLPGTCGSEQTYQRIYTAVDATGNSSVAFTVDVNMMDTTIPTFQGMIADVTINCDDVYPSLPTITAFDDCEGNLTSSIIVTPLTTPGDCSGAVPAEISTTTYELTDACGNANTYIWTVTVMDNFTIDLGPDQVACNTSSYTITAPAGNSYTWSTGATSPDITVTQDGNYEVTVTSFNGCCSIDNINITFSNGPTATAAGGVIDCSGTPVSLSSSSNVANSSYAWSGPGGFSSSMQNPTTTQTGTYTVVVTDPNGCTSSATAMVTPDNNVPDLTATGGEINCTNTSVMLNANSTNGISYSWSGPGSFTSTMQNPTVTQAGSYSVIVTAANACTNSTSIQVTDDTTAPTVSLNSGILSCNDTTTDISSNSMATITDYAWSGPGGFTATTATATVSTAGSYTLVVTAQNGCTGSSSIMVTADLATPNVSVTATDLNCNNSIANLSTTTNATTPSYSWSGPGGFSSMQANPTTTMAGVYTVIVTATNGCTSSATAEIVLDDTLPVISSIASVIDCNNPTADLTATSDDNQSSYSWSGPNGFAANTDQVTTNIAGTYQVIVTASNGCTAASSTTVTTDTISPTLSLGIGAIDCAASSIELFSTFDSSLAISWSGPGNFTSSDSTITVSQSGDYIAMVTNPSNGCSSTETITMDQDLTSPTATATGGELSCTQTNVQINGSSNNTTATYSWSGPGGYNSSLQNPNVSEAGTYTLTVSGANGCTATATAEVTTNDSLPDAIATGENLNCKNTDAALVGSTTSSGATGSWSGPNDFESDSESITVSDAGIYVWTVVSSNGCSVSASYEVTQDLSEPDAVASSSNIDCSNTMSDVSVSTTDTQAAFSWTGPGGFTSDQAKFMTAMTGTYTVIVTGANGCTNTASTSVTQDDTVPNLTLQTGAVDCSSLSVDITATFDAGLSVNWTGPSGFTNEQATITVNQNGNYTALVTDSSNGCTSMQSVTIEQDLSAPNAMAIGGTLSCTETSIQLSGSSSNTGASYSWTGPGGFSSMMQNPTVSQTGIYTLVVSNTSNCTAMTTAEVTGDDDLPDAMVVGEDLGCNETEATLTGSTTSMNTTATWSGPNGFMSSDLSITVTEAGSYTFTVLSDNGCSTSASYMVEDNSEKPLVNIVQGTIDCETESQEISLDITNAFDQITWTGPDGFSAIEQTISVSKNGTYTAVVSTITGCTSISTIDINLIFDYTTQLITNDATTTENGGAELIINGGLGPFIIEWDNGETGLIATDLEAGEHTLSIMDANGCVETVSFTINMMTSTEDVTEKINFKAYPNPISDLLQIDLGQFTAYQLILLNAQGQKINTIEIKGQNAFTLDMSSHSSGVYYLMATGEDQYIRKTIIKL